MSPEVEMLARHRLERAREALGEGDALHGAGAFRGAISRFYYAALHAARALLAVRGVDSARHSGVIHLFQTHFVKTQIIPADIARGFPRAFEKRLDTDYADFSEVTAEDALRIRSDISAFVDACTRALDGILQASDASGHGPSKPETADPA